MLLALYPRTAWGPAPQRVLTLLPRPVLTASEVRAMRLAAAPRPRQAQSRTRIIRAAAATRTVVVRAPARTIIVTAVL